ncbi:MAG TPA: toll/interleukin-1 receptor domain-containing protein [Ktedonobacteraceae bacterium]|nr:toll/interleukin-1 receptor domain-containing protein [Ktedonobacteraceae bacterium]
MKAKIFFSYAHEDLPLLNRLKTHLMPLQRQGLIEMWHDQNISAGTNWKQEVCEYLNSAQIILLLISSDFINSDYCYSVELKQALERHERKEAWVVPIILRPVVWSGTAFGELQVLPREGKPVTIWANRDEAWAEIVGQLREGIQRVALNPLSIRSEKLRETSGLTFARVALDSQCVYWKETSPDSAKKRDSFGRSYVQSFVGNAFVYPNDPCFDITLLNTTAQPVILTDVGIEIVSVADHVYAGGIPQAVKVKMAESYILHMPDIWKRVKVIDDNDFIFHMYHGLQPIYLHEVVSTPVPDPIYLQAKAPYRYRLQLAHYMARMPNETILRMWLRTNQGQERSHEIRIGSSEHDSYWLASEERWNESRSKPVLSDTELSLNNLAGLYKEQGKYEEAESLYQRVLAICEQKLGVTHSDTATSLNNLAELYRVWGKYEEAEPLYKRSLEIYEQKLAVTRPNTATCLNNLAELYRVWGKYEEAEPLYKRSLEIYEQKLGVTHPDTAICLNNLGLLYYTQGKHAEAEPLYQRALTICEQKLEATHPNTASVLGNLATLYRAQGKHAEAEPLYQRALTICEQKLEATHPTTASVLNNLATLYRVQGKHAEAEPLYQRALAIREQKLGATHPDTATSLNTLAELYQTQGKLAEAEPLYQRALVIYETVLVQNHPNTQTVRANYTALLEAMKRGEEPEG